MNVIRKAGYLVMMMLFTYLTLFFAAFHLNLAGEHDDWQERSVTVEARVTGSVPVNSNGRTRYREYVSYTYDGVSYSNIFYGITDESTRGDAVEMLIDPSQPDRIVKLHPEARFLSILLMVASVVGGTAMVQLIASHLHRVWAKQTRQRLYAPRVLNPELIRRDLDMERTQQWKLMGSTAAAYALSVIVLFACVKGPMLVALLLGAAVAACAMVSRRSLLKRPRVEVFRTELTDFTFVYTETNKRNVTEDVTVLWELRGCGSWEPDAHQFVTFAGKAYDEYTRGNRFIVAFDEGSRRILRIYDAEEFSGWEMLPEAGTSGALVD